MFEVNKQLGFDINHVMKYTDLVSIYTAADIVPINKNRLIVKNGLRYIKMEII